MFKRCLVSGFTHRTKCASFMDKFTYMRPVGIAILNSRHNIGAKITPVSLKLYTTVIDKEKRNSTRPKLIYVGMLTPQVKAVKVFSLLSSVVGIISQPFLYESWKACESVGVAVAAYSFLGFFTFVTPLLLHLLTRKYVTELYYNPISDVYAAKTVNFFCMTKLTEFSADDVKVPDIPGMFTTLIAKGKPLLIDPHNFDSPQHYAKLMGYDKPVDFKLYETAKKS